MRKLLFKLTNLNWYCPSVSNVDLKYEKSFVDTWLNMVNIFSYFLFFKDFWIGVTISFCACHVWLLVDWLIQIQYLVSRWGTDPDSLGAYSYDLVGKPLDLYEKLQAPVDNLFFGGEAVSIDHPGAVHGAYSAGILAAKDCQRWCLLKKHGNVDLIKLVSSEVKAEVETALQISRMWLILVDVLYQIQ